MKKRLEAILSGRVQMVMFRDFAQRCARKRGLFGYVENLRDGNVRVVAEGDEAKLLDLIECLHKGPVFAKVTNVDTVFSEPTDEFTRFNIKYD